MIFFITTSHSQHDSVYQQLLSISNQLISFETRFSYLCVESSAEQHISSVQYANMHSDYITFTRLNISDIHFWCGSFFTGVTELLSCYESLSKFSRLVFLNCDVLLDDWECILHQESIIETFVSCSAHNNVLTRSGYNQIFPFAPFHRYPFYGSSLSESKSFYCDVVPTRCIIIPPQALFKLSHLRWLPNYLPHYGSDFIISKYLSSSLGSRWLVRNDTFIVEDFSSTGLKPINTSSITLRILSLFNRKSIFNWRLILVYPFLYCYLFLPFYYWIPYLFLYWIKFCLLTLFL